MIVRIVKGVTNHFPIRVTDWLSAAMLVNFGLVLLSPANTFAASPAYAMMARVAPEEAWGLVSLFVGLIRIAALLVNGTFPRFRWSPHIRFVASMLSCFVWFQVAFGLELSGSVTTGLAVYRYLVVLEIYNVYLTASEAGEVERKRKRYGGSRSD